MSRMFLSPRMEAIEIARARFGDDPRLVADKLGIPLDNVIGAFRVLDTIVTESDALEARREKRERPKKRRALKPTMGYPKDAA